jgi:hypothetical protein
MDIFWNCLTFKFQKRTFCWIDFACSCLKKLFEIAFWTIQRHILLVPNAFSVFTAWIYWYMALNVLGKSLNLTLSDMFEPGLEFPWNKSTAMALKIAVERNSCLRQFWQFPRHFSNYCNKNLILLLLWIVDKLETYLRISLVFFFEENWDWNSDLRMIWWTSEFKYQSSNAQWIV